MKCLECGAAMDTGVENHRFAVSGLAHVVLVGMTIHRCRQCGDFEVEIPRIADLHRLMARLLLEKGSRLMGEEVRFLRKYLGLSGARLARRLGVTTETVSRWENDAAPIGGQADRLLRLVVAQGKLRLRLPDELLDGIDSKVGEPRPMRLGQTAEGWAEVRSGGGVSSGVTARRTRRKEPTRRRETTSSTR